MNRDRVLAVTTVATVGLVAVGVWGWNEYQQSLNREALFAEVQPVKLANCELERFGDSHDGGYLICGNLLAAEKSGYSYGINGTDNFGCEVAVRLQIPVHQYDCFNLARPPCFGDATVFHQECIGPVRLIEEGRVFDTLQSQIARNGDEDKRLIVKMDVEGAEWASFLGAPESVLNQINQIVVEFHHADGAEFVETMRKLKRTFYVAHLHYNNHACEPHHEPFPSWAFEVLFVNRNLGVVDAAGTVALMPHPLDAPNNPTVPDCQAARPVTLGSIFRLTW
ncbi:MAG: FkbM family methyltransferase [Acidobacteria bacterium]|nr:FkbM family methyltransferase [Acidobacteriota bacterium]